MNTADRSIGRLDLPLRRRFHFFHLLPSADVLDAWLAADDERNACGLSGDMLAECNRFLHRTYDVPEEQAVGHALFMTRAQSDVQVSSRFVRQVVRHSVVPYVRELLVERGRDPGEAARRVEQIFAPCWAVDEDGDDEAYAAHAAQVDDDE